MNEEDLLRTRVRLESLLVVKEEMLLANRQREFNNEAPAYNENDLANLANEIRELML